MMKENTKIPETDQEKVRFLVNTLNFTEIEAMAVVYNINPVRGNVALTQEEYDYIQKYGADDPAVPGIMEKPKNGMLSGTLIQINKKENQIGIFLSG